MALTDSTKGTALPSADSNATLAIRDNSNIEANTSITPEVVDPHWVNYEIDRTRWNQYYPYQLLVVEPVNGSYAQSQDFTAFTLPIPPQEIAIQMPMAIATSVTMGGGIIEEHNAAPFRMIHFSGTMGVMPVRASGDVLGTRSMAGSIFAGTIRAASALPGIVNSAYKKTAISADNGADNSGYYQWHLMQRFFEQYINVKKTERGSKLRLALAIWKDSAVYLITPINVDTRKSASSPNEYTYSLSFKAWKRISLEPAYATVDFTQTIREQSTLASVLGRVTQARRIIHGVQNVAVGINADVSRVIETIREVTYGVKEATGAVKSFMDLPGNIRDDAKSAVLGLAAAGQDFAQKILGVGGKNDLSPKSNAAIDALRAASIRSQKVDVGSGSATLSPADPAHKIIDNADEYFDLFDKISIGSLKLPPDTIKRINQESDRVRKFTRLDYEQRRDFILKTAQDMADAMGAGDEAFNAVYGRGGKDIGREPTDDEWELLFQLNEVAMQLGYLAAVGDIKPTVSPMSYVAGLARQSGIVFREPRSKFAIPYPYGSTLPQIAMRHLGDPDRWNEIAALNGLRYPYVDENGFDLPLLTDGRGNQVVVADATNLYVGQPVRLASTATSRTQRHVRAIERISISYCIITLDGDAPLDSYLTTDGASLHAFMPDTVNSQMMLYIPSDRAINEATFNTKSIPGVDIFDNLIQLGGVDLLLTPSGDLAITQDGDCRLAIGLTNIVQRVRVALSTPQGSLLRHPEFGLGLKKGMSTADLNANQLLDASVNLFKGDPAFAGVQAASVVKNGTTLTVSIAVALAGGNQVIPVTVQIQK